MSTSDDEPKVRPVSSENYEKVAPLDSPPGDRVDEPAAKRPWLSIGRRFVEGVPGLKIRRR